VLPAEITLIESSGGVFEIVADGVLVHSKKQSGEYPDETALLQKLRTL